MSRGVQAVVDLKVKNMWYPQSNRLKSSIVASPNKIKPETHKYPHKHKAYKVSLNWLITISTENTLHMYIYELLLSFLAALICFCFDVFHILE